MQRIGYRSLAILHRVSRSEYARLILALAIGKVAVLLAVFAAFKTPDFLYQMSTRWDASVLQDIASSWYTIWWQYHWTPVYPAMIKVVGFVVGPIWISGLLVTNAFSFAFPIILYKTFGFRTALLAELFPTYLVFSTIPYSDVVTLTFLALAVFLVLRGRLFSPSLSLGLALVNMYNAAFAVPSFIIAIRASDKLKRLLFFGLPVAAGLSILLWLRLETGNYLAELTLEQSAWRVTLADPITQAMWILNINGVGWLTGEYWRFLSITLTPTYWFVRNVVFEVFYFAGIFYLLKTDSPHRYFLFAFSLSVSVPLLFYVGALAIGDPRLLLAAFPVFYAYSNLLNKRFDWVYTFICYALAMGIVLLQTLAWFA